MSIALPAHPLFTLGYAGLDVRRLAVWTSQNWPVMVLDVRLNPWSRDEQWRKRALVERFNVLYEHVPELGNRHYRDASKPVVLKDPKRGLMMVRAWLTNYRVVLLCGCPKWDACHRADIVRLLVAEYGPLDVRHLAHRDMPYMPRHASPLWGNGFRPLGTRQLDLMGFEPSPTEDQEDA
jgi:hypothetical protein